jgi:hypothetical protein
MGMDAVGWIAAMLKTNTICFRATAMPDCGKRYLNAAGGFNLEQAMTRALVGAAFAW